MPTFYHNGAKNKRDAIWAFYKNFVKANFPLILLKAKVFFVKISFSTVEKLKRGIKD